MGIDVVDIGWLDAGKSYRAMITDMQKSLPARYDCIASQALGEPQRAMLHYYANVVSHRDEIASRSRDCDLLLVQGVVRDETPPAGRWKKLWESSRPGDKVERYRLYQRIR